MNKYSINIFVTLLLLAFSACGAKGTRVTNLLCDYAENPLAIENPNPQLKWQLLSDEKAKSQSAYRIIVSGDLSSLANDQGDYWDSGKTMSLESVIKYQGITTMTSLLNVCFTMRLKLQGCLNRITMR